MWNLFNQRRAMEKEVFETLRPGDLYGGPRRRGWQPEDLVRYILLANGTGLTFFVVLLSGVGSEVRAHTEFVSSVWLLGTGVAIAVGAWLLFRLSRAREVAALGKLQDEQASSEISAPVKRVMKRAAVMKLLGFRVVIVSAISSCVGLYLGLKGFFLL